MQVADVIAAIERHAPPAGQADWDVSGVQVAATTDEVTRLAVMLDATPATVDGARDFGAHLVLTHHPLGLPARLPNRLDSYHTVLTTCLCSQMWLYAAHTSLDVATGPVADHAGWLADALGLTDVSVLEPTGMQESAGQTEGAGFGRVGTLPHSADIGAFTSLLAQHVNPNHLRVAVPEGPSGPLEASHPISRVAFCGGSGAFMAGAAARAGADVLVTGDVKYHQAQEAPLVLVDVGHFSLEEEMMRRLAATLAAELAPRGVEVHFFEGRDPFTCRMSDKEQE